MSDIIKPPLPGKRCGTCVFGLPVSGAGVQSDPTLQCLGMPPQVIFLGFGQDLAGRQGAKLDGFVPNVQASRPACSLWRVNPAAYDA